MRRAELAHRDVRFGLEPLVKRQGNVRLTDTGLSGEHHRATFATPGVLPATQQHLDFLVTPNWRRQSGFVLCLETAFHFGCSQDLPGWYWLRPSFKRDRAEIAVFEMPISEPVRTLGNQHGTGIGERLQARSQVRRLANDRPLLSRAFAGQIAHDHHTGSDANANL